MPDLTKKDIKEIFVETLEPFAKAVQEDFAGMNKRFDGVESRLGGVESRLGGVESRLDRVEFTLAEVKKDVDWMKENSSELFTKLDKLIALYEKQEQEVLILSEHVRRLEERFEKRIAKLEAERK